MPKCGEPAFAAQAETLLIDAAIAKDLLGAIANDLLAAGCALRGDAAACDLVPAMTPATEAIFTLNIWMRFYRLPLSMILDRPLPISPNMDRRILMRSSPNQPLPQRSFLPRSTARLSCITPLHNLPMAANLAWARKLALPPGDYMRVDLLARRN
jgi:hypothetical protein